MGFFNNFIKKSNPQKSEEKRMKKVKSLDDQLELEKFARSDSNEKIRYVALSKLTDQDAIYRSYRRLHTGTCNKTSS